MLSDVIVDGTTSVKDQVVSGENGSVTYTFSNVTSEHTITAMFTPIRYTITTITDEGAEITGIYENHICSECGGYDHECKIVNIFIEANHAEISEE